MTFHPLHLRGTTTHARRGTIKNAFRYGVDFVLLDPEDTARGPSLFSRNRFNFLAVHDRDHGGINGQGRGAPWVRKILTEHGFSGHADIRLLTQPRMLGYEFNPVSFWFVYAHDALCAVISEVNNPFGDRHCYLSKNPDFAPITKTDLLITEKVFHVSPFQRVAGNYAFTFDITQTRIAIKIALSDKEDGVIATLFGDLTPLSNASILSAALRRPAGALRTIFLIYWQALKLRLKGAPYRRRPKPPAKEVT